MVQGSRDVPITVVVCTRNRGDLIVETVASILASEYSDVELLVIDQSTDESTMAALVPFSEDGRVRYLHSDETGVSKSRTLGLREARTEFVLSTDDDCVVDAGWIAGNVRALVEHPNAAIVFGDVLAAATPASGGYAPSVQTDEDFVVSSMRSWKTNDGANIGMGASMAMRRSVLLELGGFDDQLGPGSALGNGEDTDIAIRAVLGGFAVVRTNRTSVVHFGHRTHEEFRRLVRTSLLSIGAICGKHVRRRPLATMRIIVEVVWRVILRVVLVDLAHLRKPPVWGKTVSFGRGLWLGLRKPLEPRPHLLFRQSTSAVS